MDEQYNVKLNLLKEEIRKNNLTWISGETDISKIKYRDFKNLNVPYDFLFYKGGIFEEEANNQDTNLLSNNNQQQITKENNFQSVISQTIKKVFYFKTSGNIINQNNLNKYQTIKVTFSSRPINITAYVMGGPCNNVEECKKYYINKQFNTPFEITVVKEIPLKNSNFYSFSINDYEFTHKINNYSPCGFHIDFMKDYFEITKGSTYCKIKYNNNLISFNQQIPYSKDGKNVFEIELIKLLNESLPNQFDYRNYNGENWMTPVKNQLIPHGGCGSCWVFATIGTLEARANLYFNEHLNLNLSEQEILTCSGGGSCEGGNPLKAINYTISNGINENSCSPYTANDDNCSKCSNPEYKVKSTEMSENCNNQPFRSVSYQNESYILSQLSDFGIKYNLIEEGPEVGEITWISGGGLLTLLGFSGGGLLGKNGILGSKSGGFCLQANGGNALGGIFTSIAMALAAGQLFEFIFSIFASGRNMHALDSILYYAIATGAAVGIILSLIPSVVASLGVPIIGWIAAAVVIVILALYEMFSYQDYSQDIFSYHVLKWQPVKGGDNCEKCNDLAFGCSEYQCHSFGTACDIVNKGTTQEACIWQNRSDIQGPEISPMDSVLNQGYSYEPLNSVAPPNKGVKILYKGTDSDANFCIPPFTSLTLGVSTNKPAYCKIDLSEKNNLSDMMSDMSEGYIYIYNHTVLIPSSVNPSQSSLNGFNLTDENGNPILLDAGQDKTFFIRCESTNGIMTPYNFLMQFCVQSGPDTMAPIITGTNYLSTSNYVASNLQKAYLQVYTNEPADCKWDFQDLGYDEMANNMSGCSQNVSTFLIPSKLKYGCETNLTGIKNEQDNTYYIRCKDQPWFKGTQDEPKRNANKISYELILTGTSDLAIENVSVNSKSNNSIIKDSANQTEVVLRVDTAGGAQNGLAKCQYNVGGSWISFFNDGSLDYLNENMQKLFLTPGIYNYPIRCFDMGGNLAYNSVGFTVEQDTTPPSVLRVYSDNNQIKLITDEESECVYSVAGCSYSFDDGVQMSTTDNLNHYADWTTDTDLFIKCKDIFGNKPLYDSCSIVVRGSQY